MPATIYMPTIPGLVCVLDERQGGLCTAWQAHQGTFRFSQGGTSSPFQSPATMQSQYFIS